MKWLFPYIRMSDRKPDAYIMDEAIHELDYIEWLSDSKVEIGDIVYLYSGLPDQFIKYKCKVTKVGKNKTVNDERKYNGSGPELFFPCFDIVLEYEFNTPITLDELAKHGVSKKRIPIQRSVKKPELFNFLEQKEIEDRKKSKTHLDKSELLSDMFDEKLIDLVGKDKEAIVKIRINQSVFRERLLKKYKKCCLCGMDNQNLLFASHIKPWSKSNKTEKTDINNGLLLCPNHDQAFDKGYISFDEKGKLLISNSLKKDNIKLLNLNSTYTIEVNSKNKKYINYHRNNIFKKS